MEENYTIGQIFDKTVSRICHFEGVISDIINTPLIPTNERKEIEKMQNAIDLNRKALITFFNKVFNSFSMASHMVDKLYEDCYDMKGFYLNFDAQNRNYFLFNDY